MSFLKMVAQADDAQQMRRYSILPLRADVDCCAPKGKSQPFRETLDTGHETRYVNKMCIPKYNPF